MKKQWYEHNPNSAQAARDLTVSLERLGNLYFYTRLGDAEIAFAHYDETLELRKNLYETNPNSAQAAREFAVSHFNLGNYYFARGQTGDAARALDHYQRSLDLRERLYQANYDSTEAIREVDVSL